MIDYKYAELFEDDSTDKRWKIIPVDFIGHGTPKEGISPETLVFKTYFDCASGIYYKMKETQKDKYEWVELNGESELTVIRNEDLFNQSVELSESLCSETELRFGCCEASSFKFKVANIVKSLKGMWLNVSVVLEHHEDSPLLIGRYKVDSDKLTADKLWHEVVAYDVMYDIINTDMAEWYNSFLPEGRVINLGGFRSSFINYFGIKEKETVLVNDDMLVERTIDPEHISGLDIISAICEINGCFGHIGRDGKFHYIYLQQDTMGLYPSEDLYPGHAPEYLPQAETGNLYPQEPNSFEIKRSCCVSCNYEDYIVSGIKKVWIRQDENDAGVQYPKEGSGKENTYIIEDNFLTYGKGAVELSEILKNILKKIKDIVYRPFDADVRANLCLEAGDAISISTRFHIVESYILKREMKGGQAIRDKISSEGVEEYSEKVSGIQRTISQLKGKTNVLERDAEHTKETITNLETGAQTQKEQTDELIRTTVKKDNLRSEISQAPGVISLEAGEITIQSGKFTLDEKGNITLKGAISLAWEDDTTRPTTWEEYKFVETDYNLAAEDGGIYYAREPYLVIKSPRGNNVIEIGNRNYSQNESKFKMKDTPRFPNGAVIEHAFIESLHQTDKFSRNITNGSEWVSFHYRISGAFVLVYGSYHTYSQKAGEYKEIVVGGSEELFVPTYANARTIGISGKRVFIFVLTTDGKFTARNSSEIDFSSETADGINFRFDFFRF